MTADADVRPGRRGGAPFELLRFSATPVPGALVVVEVEGRVTASGRFTRGPVLVVEAGENRPRLELAPSRSTLDGDRWRAAYALPAEAFAAARFALGLRGTLLDLPHPDEPTTTDRETTLAREANTLRRQLETAEATAATARAEATAAAGELGAAVSAARDEALAESSERIADLEREVVEAHRLAASDAAEARAAHTRALAEAAAQADERLRAADARADEASESLRAANARADAAEEALDARARSDEAPALADVDPHERRRAADAEARALAAEEGIAVLRAELLEERERSQTQIAELEADRDAATRRLEALRHAADADASQVTDAARLADLEQQLASAHARIEALRRADAAADAEPGRPSSLWAAGSPRDARASEPSDGAPDPRARARQDDPDRTQVLSAVEIEDDTRSQGDDTRPFPQRSKVAGDDDSPGDATHPFGPGRANTDDGHSASQSGDANEDDRPSAPAAEDDTRPFTPGEHRDAQGETLLPLERGALPHAPSSRSPAAYVAVAALALFVFVLLGLLLGFLP